MVLSKVHALFQSDKTRTRTNDWSAKT